MRPLTRAVLVAAALATFPLPAAATLPQDGAVVVERVPALSPGWLGFRSSVTVEIGQDGGRMTGSSLRIAEVFRDGPADRAGLRPDDLLIGFNGAPLAVERFQSLAQRLRPGDPMSLVVVRDGRRAEVVVTAAPRPAVEDMVPIRLQQALDASRRTFVARLDAAREGVETTVDLPRLELGRIRADSVRSITITSEGGVGRMALRTPDGVFEWITATPDGDREPRTFSAWVYRPDEPGAEARPVIVTTREGSDPGASPRATSATVTLRTRVSDNAGELRPSSERWPVVSVRPLAPYLAGMNRVAGAEFTPLSNDLATYFHVDGGLLVTDVAERTPAADTGLIPGDVIVAAGGRSVTSVDALRAALSAREGPLVLSLVRRGMRVDVRLGR